MIEGDFDFVIAKRLDVIGERARGRIYRRLIIISFEVLAPHCVIDIRRDGLYEFRKTKQPQNPIKVDIIIKRISFKRINLLRILNEKYYAYDWDRLHVYDNNQKPGYLLRISDVSDKDPNYSGENVIRSYCRLTPGDIKDPGHILKYLLRSEKEKLAGIK